MSQAGSNNTSGGGGGGSGIQTITGNSGGAVGPDGGGNVTLIGTGTVTVTGSPGTNTLSIGVSGSTWTQVSTNTVMTSNISYICISPGGVLNMTLPATSSQGDVIRLVLFGATGYKIVQGTGQSIVYGSASTTTGVTGFIQSVGTGNAISLVCVVANTTWLVMNSVGNFGVN